MLVEPKMPEKGDNTTKVQEYQQKWGITENTKNAKSTKLTCEERVWSLGF